MDSEDDVHDFEDDDRDHDHDFYAGAGDDVDEDIYYSDVNNDAISNSNDDESPKNAGGNYTILKEADINQRMNDDIRELSTILSVSKHEASILLRHYNWSASKVYDAWFADESLVRQKVGLLTISPQPKHNNTICGICFESCDYDSIKSAGCGHPFCAECWGLYINSSVNDGPGCLMLRCPEPSCVLAVGDDIINELAFEEDKNKYYRYLSRSYVEDSKTRKWCPAAGCDCAIDFLAAGDENFDVSCLCSHFFCWNCCEEPHRPVECKTVEKWNLRSNSESENESWKKAYTKPCPQCKRPIEKNHGCMHMMCSLCKFAFCWVCLQSWTRHGYGGTCNRFKGDLPDEEESVSLRKDLIRYQHYYDRWAANEKSRKIAMADLQRVEGKDIEEISSIQGKPVTELEFLTAAWKQIVECRRVLKWTYAYGYYLPAKEDAKRQLFEYLQGQAEHSLERLHGYAEKELKKFLDPNSPYDEFRHFREKLSRLTRVTKNYFENLVRALENGLSDVTCGSDVGSSSSSGEQKKKRKYSRMRSEVATRLALRGSGNYTGEMNGGFADTGAPPASQTDMRSVVLQNTLQEEWSCEFCTFVNPGSARTCEACDRGGWSCQFCTFANSRDATTCLMCDENR